MNVWYAGSRLVAFYQVLDSALESVDVGTCTSARRWFEGLGLSSANPSHPRTPSASTPRPTRVIVVVYRIIVTFESRQSFWAVMAVSRLS